MTSVDGLLKKLDRAGNELIAATRTGVNAAAALMAAAVDTSIAGDTHGTMGLAGMGSKKITAKVNPAGSTANPSALINTTNAGAMKILESGAKPHVVGAGKGAQGVAKNKFGVIHAITKTGGKSYKATFMGNAAAGIAGVGPWVAGGSSAKHTFSRAVNASEPAVLRAVHAETSKAVFGAFR